MAVSNIDIPREALRQNYTQGGTHMTSLGLRFVFCTAVVLLAAAGSVYGQEQERYISDIEISTAGYGATEHDITYSDGSFRKVLARYDFNLTIDCPTAGSSIDVGEECTFTGESLNGNGVDEKFEIRFYDEDDDVLYEDTIFDDDFSFTHTFTYAAEYTFRVRGEECTTFSGTECYRTKLLVFDVGPRPANTPPQAFDSTIQATAGVQKCVNLRQSQFVTDAETPLSGLGPFEIVTKPNVGTTTLSGSNLCFTSPTNFDGSLGVVWRVSDGTDWSNPATVTFEIDKATPPDNDPPTLSVPNDFSMQRGTSVLKEITAADPDGDDVDIDIVSAPNFVSIAFEQDKFMRLRFAPTSSTPLGTYTIQMRATDDHGNEVARSFRVTVTSTPGDGDPEECQDLVWPDPNQQNVPLTVSAGGLYSYILDVESVNGGAVALSFDPLNEAKWLRLDGMRVHGTAPNAPGRTDTVHLRATDLSTGCQIKLVWNLSVVTSVGVEDEGELPQAVVLEQNYPNPFNPSTTVRFALPQSMHVRLAIYNLLGQEMMVVADELFSAGSHEVHVDISDSGWSSGVYILRLESKESTLSKMMTLQK